jgi:hypothetical protein
LAAIFSSILSSPTRRSDTLANVFAFVRVNLYYRGMNREQLQARRSHLKRIAQQHTDAGRIYLASNIRKEISEIDLQLSGVVSIIEIVDSKVLSTEKKEAKTCQQLSIV